MSKVIHQNSQGSNIHNINTLFSNNSLPTNVFINGNGIISNILANGTIKVANNLTNNKTISLIGDNKSNQEYEKGNFH